MLPSSALQPERGSVLGATAYSAAGAAVAGSCCWRSPALLPAPGSWGDVLGPIVAVCQVRTGRRFSPHLQPCSLTPLPAFPTSLAGWASWNKWTFTSSAWWPRTSTGTRYRRSWTAGPSSLCLRWSQPRGTRTTDCWLVCRTSTRLRRAEHRMGSRRWRPSLQADALSLSPWGCTQGVYAVTWG